MALGVALTAGPAAAAGPPCPLELAVVGTERRPVAGARVTVVESGETATTRGSRPACLRGLGAGEHRLVVVAEGFLVRELEVELPVGDDRPARREVTLAPAFGEELVVTATRTERRLADVPVHVQVMGREQIESAKSRTLAEAVEWTSGVRVESNCQNCNFSQVRLLGLEGPYSQILVDGQPTVSSLAMVYGIEQIPARLIDSIEVVKGGGSAAYGAGAVGGVINLITHQPAHTSAEVEARWVNRRGEDGGSLSALGDWASGDGSRTVSGFAQLDRVEPVDVDGDGFTEVTRRELRAFGLRLQQYLLDDRARLGLDLSSFDEDRRGGDSLHLRPHEALLAEEILTDRRVATLTWMHTFSERLDYRAALSFSDTARDSYYGAGRDPNAYGTTDNPMWILDGQADHHRAAGTVTWGVQATRDRIDDVQLGYDRVLEETYETAGVFLQEDRQVRPGVTVLYGARLDDHSALAEPILSPRAAVLWAPRPELTVRASAATGFRPPVVFDEDLHITLVGGGEAQVVRNDPDLVEESSRSYMLGADWRPTFGRRGSGAFEVNLFRTELDDLFDRQEADDPATPAVELVRTNFGEAEVEGVELAAAFRWGSRLSGELGLTRQSARFGQPEPDFGSRDFFRTPETYGLAWLRWAGPREVDLFVGALYTGPMVAAHYAGFIAEDRLERTPSFLTWDLNVSKAFSVGAASAGGEGTTLRLTAGVRNLTDDYQEDLDRGPDRDSNYVYGPRFPRSWFLGLKVER